MGTDPELAARFVRALPDGHPIATAASQPALADALAGLCERGAADRPEVVVERGRFVDFVARAAASACRSIGDLESLRAADLWLAAACADADPRALAVVERDLMPGVRTVLARIDHSGGDLTTEIEQVVRERLFVASKIESYQGRGPLAAFLEVTATRELLMELRRHRREVRAGDGAILDLAPADSDPALDYVRRTYRATVEAALAESLTELDLRDRSVLRYAFVHRMSTAQIGAIYQVDKSTAFRWLRAARERLLASIRLRVAAALDIAPGDVDSIVRLVESRVDLTLDRVLAS